MSVGKLFFLIIANTCPTSWEQGLNLQSLYACHDSSTLVINTLNDTYYLGWCAVWDTEIKCTCDWSKTMHGYFADMVTDI